MNPRRNEASSSHKYRNVHGEGPNWILIAGGALLSTISIRLGYKLKQALETRKQPNSSNTLKENVASERRKSAGCRVHLNMYSFDDDGNEGAVEVNHPPNGQTLSDPDVALPLVAVTPPEFSRANGVMWASSPDRLELPPKPFHHSNCSDSPRVSESGSDIFIKREVIQKLRQQLKRRDDMILEMQDQITELQNSLNTQLDHSAHLESQLEIANGDLFESERVIQRLRKAIADHCVNEKPSTAPIWPHEARNGHTNGYVNGDMNYSHTENGKGDSGKIEMLKSEIGELKEILEGKEYVLKSYKEQKTELSVKIKELQQRLDSQLPNIL
ncbi:hypothetical protein ACFE04_028825 [Oxalis oulophora]